VARTDIEPVLGLPTGTICRLASAYSYPALLRGLLARIRHPLVRVGDQCAHRRLTMFTTSLTIAAQPGTFALQDLTVGLELRRPALKLRADAFDLDPCRFITLLKRAGLQPTQIAPVHFERRRLTFWSSPAQRRSNSAHSASPRACHAAGAASCRTALCSCT
jgi:hypothetical protein